MTASATTGKSRHYSRFNPLECDARSAHVRVSWSGVRIALVIGVCLEVSAPDDVTRAGGDLGLIK